MLSTGMTLVLIVVAGLLGSCATAPASREDKAALVAEVTSRWQQMCTEDPTVTALVQKGYGYGLFPDVGKGGLVVGGAYGRGVVYERGQHIGYSDLTQGSVGLQAGGQSFSDLLVFENKAAFDRFKAGQFGLAADASAVVLKSGVATNARFVDGVAVVVQPIGGVMVEAAIGGQQCTIRRSEHLGSVPNTASVLVQGPQWIASGCGGDRMRDGRVLCNYVREASCFVASLRSTQRRTICYTV
jgi:lipid-binding SYLF domain-containing protein